MEGIPDFGGMDPSNMGSIVSRFSSSPLSPPGLELPLLILPFSINFFRTGQTLVSRLYAYSSCPSP